MPGAPGYANQITGLNFDSDHRFVQRMNVKQSVARDDESHFVFVVPVFAIEFRKHCVKPGCFGANINQIGRDVTAAAVQFFDFLGVSAEDFVCRRIIGDRISE